MCSDGITSSTVEIFGTGFSPLAYSCFKEMPKDVAVNASSIVSFREKIYNLSLVLCLSNAVLLFFRGIETGAMRLVEQETS